MDCPLMRFKNGFVDLTVQKLQRDRPLDVWSTSSSERETFWVVVDVTGNCGDHMTGDRAESKSVNTVAKLALSTEEEGVLHLGAGSHPTAHLRSFLSFFFFAEATLRTLCVIT